MTLARGQHPRLDRAEPRQRPVPVALPLRRRSPLLQQPRQPRAGGQERQRERLSSTSPPASAAAKAPPAAAYRCYPRATSDQRIGLHRSHARRQQRLLRDRGTAACPRTPTRPLTSTTRATCSAASPCLTPPSPPPAGCAETETCRPAAPAQQIPGGAAGSATFSGPGNVVSAPPAATGSKPSRARAPSAKPLTRAQKLTRALRSCRSQHAHAKKKRRACERAARRRYGSASARGRKRKAQERGHRALGRSEAMSGAIDDCAVRRIGHAAPSSLLRSRARLMLALAGAPPALAAGAVVADQL